MYGLDEHKYMDNFTTIGYIIAIVIFIITLFTQNFILLIPMAVEIIVLRLIGYSIDRIVEMKKDK